MSQRNNRIETPEAGKDRKPYAKPTVTKGQVLNGITAKDPVSGDV